MHLGPGVYVGPVYALLGVVLIIWHRPVGQRLARWWPKHELATPSGVVIVGVCSIIAAGLAILVGFGIIR
ncbi:hypothetical protein [Kineococcus terrestris]|uniref:hypothetical protein n=1 Tax=Kineococcus terrestris TaxID=2044856 RepID=UPI0034DB2FEA